MGSLNAQGIPVVNKVRLVTRRQGRYTTVSSGTNPFGADTTDLSIRKELPDSVMASGLFGTQGSEAVDSFANLGGLVIRYQSEIDDRTDTIAEEIAISSGTQPEFANLIKTQNSTHHAGNRIIRNNSIDDTVARVDNS